MYSHALFFFSFCSRSFVCRELECVFEQIFYMLKSKQTYTQNEKKREKISSSSSSTRLNFDRLRFGLVFGYLYPIVSVYFLLLDLFSSTFSSRKWMNIWSMIDMLLEHFFNSCCWFCVWRFIITATNEWPMVSFMYVRNMPHFIFIKNYTFYGINYNTSCLKKKIRSNNLKLHSLKMIECKFNDMLYQLWPMMIAVATFIFKQFFPHLSQFMNKTFKFKNQILSKRMNSPVFLTECSFGPAFFELHVDTFSMNNRLYFVTKQNRRREIANDFLKNAINCRSFANETEILFVS